METTKVRRAMKSSHEDMLQPHLLTKGRKNKGAHNESIRASIYSSHSIRHLRYVYADCGVFFNTLT